MACFPRVRHLVSSGGVYGGDIPLLLTFWISLCVMSVMLVLQCRLMFTNFSTSIPGRKVYTKASTILSIPACTIVFYQSILQRKGGRKPQEEDIIKEVDKIALRRWRKRGFYSENVLVKLLQKRGCRAVRIPVSNPSLSPLPDIIARKDLEIYAFEVKNASYYAYFPAQQIDKLFRFLSELIPTEKEHKHAVVAAHLGKKWIFKEINWGDWEKDKLPEKVRILKRDRGNLTFENATQTCK